ncbi:hypothetical protein DITRI_Ditri14bG0118900 [Diplodiscus trichospermus]
MKNGVPAPFTFLVGTILKLTFVPGNSSYTERFIEINDEKMVKVAKGLEGGCLATGCSVQIVRFDIIEKQWFMHNQIRHGLCFQE